MKFLKKLFGFKDNQKQKETNKETNDNIETILESNNKPEVLYESKVRLVIGGDKELNAENAFNTMGISNENIKSRILEYYVWQSYSDLDPNFNCTMKLVRLDVQEKYKPDMDGETAIHMFFNQIKSEDIEENQETQLIDHPDLDKFKQVPWMTDLRLNNVAICLNAGFKPANSLPTQLNRSLRPTIEIAKRLNAIKALILWFMVSEESLNSNQILSYIKANDLKNFMTDEEKDFLNTSRNDEQIRNSIGWKFENTWPLAWYFGYKEPEFTGQMMSGEQIQIILKDFSCPLDQNIENWIKDKQTIAKKELIEKEDLFYCLHNAVRSSQMGRDTVPNNFDPIGNGGVIHERRHALTWMLSKETNWADTDLST